MNVHGNRIEDIGLGRLIKFWPILMSIFTAGAWYQSATTTKEVMMIIRKQTDEHEHRITQVEDAVIYLKEIVSIQKTR